MALLPDEKYIHWCANCEAAVSDLQAVDNKCPVCQGELTQLGPHIEPLPR